MIKTKHYRSVTLELSQANMGDFNTEEYLSALSKGGFNTIVCFGVGYLNGETYFDSKLLKKNPSLKSRDIFNELIILKKKYNFNFFAYLNTQFSDIGNKQPTWNQRRVDGKKTTQLKASTICPNSPYKNLLLKQLSFHLQLNPIQHRVHQDKILRHNLLDLQFPILLF